jgi:hypothetical protein
MGKPLRDRLQRDAAMSIQVHCAKFIQGQIDDTILIAGIEERCAVLQALTVDGPVLERVLAVQEALNAAVGRRLFAIIEGSRAAHAAGEATQVGN